MTAQTLGTKGKRVAIIAGLRTPFAKQNTAYAALTALDLGTLVVRELLQRLTLSPKEVQQVVFGQVIPSVSAPNVAREIVLAADLPRSLEAFSVARACATGYQAAINVAEAIAAGTIDCGLAGGTDSASDIPMVLSKPLTDALLRLSKARTLGERLDVLRTIKPKDLVPIPPALKERSTGLTMGESAEKMAKENAIKREDQDAFAHRSHTRATAAWDSGHFSEQVMQVYVPPAYREVLERDNLVRRDSKVESYAGLKPVFDRRHGTVTAGNSSPLTDGASAVLLMREDKAQALGLTPLGFVRSYAFAALDPSEQLLMGPAYATPLALERAGMTLKDIDLIDMHEAFSAQILSNTQAFESKRFAEEKLGRSQPIGQVNWDAFNIDGGSIAIGHPFAATGGRQITQALWAMRRLNKSTALCSACAAGGLGAAIVLEAQ